MFRPTLFECMVVGIETVILVVFGISFLATPSTEMFTAVSRDLYIVITPKFFAVLSALGVLLSLMTLLGRTPHMRAYLYATAASPLAFYCIPLAWFLILNHRSFLVIVLLSGYFFLFILLAIATWLRPGGKIAESIDG